VKHLEPLFLQLPVDSPYMHVTYARTRAHVRNTCACGRASQRAPPHLSSASRSASVRLRRRSVSAASFAASSLSARSLAVSTCNAAMVTTPTATHVQHRRTQLRMSTGIDVRDTYALIRRSSLSAHACIAASLSSGLSVSSGRAALSFCSDGTACTDMVAATSRAMRQTCLHAPRRCGRSEPPPLAG
jgi:hypothetical protein